eukprot:4379146-Prymnesium_polylepis.1
MGAGPWWSRRGRTRECLESCTGELPDLQTKLDAAIAARKECAKRAREAPSHCCGGPCLCTPKGALEVLREERREWQTALNGAVKVAKGAAFMSRWLTHSTAAPTAE